MRSPGGLVAFLSVVVLGAFGASTAGAGTVTPHSEQALFVAMNQARTSRGLKPLSLDTRLERAARAHSDEMLRGGYFAHGSFGRRLSSFGVHGPFIGENLAWGVGRYGRADVIVGEWLRSPEHRANLLRPGFRRVGVGSVVGAFAGRAHAVVVTADFAGR